MPKRSKETRSEPLTPSTGHGRAAHLKRVVSCNYVFIVKCPSCGHNQRYQPKTGVLTKKSKRCVYCGRTFKVHSSLPKSRIVKKE